MIVAGGESGSGLLDDVQVWAGDCWSTLTLTLASFLVAGSSWSDCYSFLLSGAEFWRIFMDHTIVKASLVANQAATENSSMQGSLFGKYVLLATYSQYTGILIMFCLSGLQNVLLFVFHLSHLLLTWLLRWKVYESQNSRKRCAPLCVQSPNTVFISRFWLP